MSNERAANIAVIMSTYAEKSEWLKVSIESILGQTYEDFRFYIALDNPENHELNEIVREYAFRDGRIVVISNERNKGAAESRNGAIFVSREPFVAVMDADDISHPERLEKELAYLHAHDLDLVMCGADILSHGQVVPGRVLPDLPPEAFAEIEKHTNASFHASWLVRRKVYETLHGYREGICGEDYDFVLRAIQAGFKVGRMAAMLMVYRLAENGISYSYWMDQELHAAYLRERYRRGVDLEEVTPADLAALTETMTERQRERYAAAKASYDDLFAAVEGRKLLSVLGVALKGASNPVFRKKMRDTLAERRAVARICKNDSK